MNENTQTIEKSPVKYMDAQEWQNICIELENYHAIFYKLWQIGKPIFSDIVPTAAVQFDRCGDFVYFYFNPEFWEKCSNYEKIFVICHETLHVILNHGKRAKDAINLNRQACNAAMDIVVNHMLLRNFGFERDKIKDWGKLCWVDTVFKQPDGTIKTDKGKKIPDDDCFEYYMTLFEKINSISIGIGKENKEGLGTVDDHSLMGKSDFDEIIEHLDEELSDEEKKSIEKLIEKHFAKDKDQKAGTGTGGQWHFAKTENVVKKKKWETVIKKWTLQYLTEENNNKEQWARLNRRYSMLPKHMFLPTEMEVEDTSNEKNRIRVYFFLDTSGSCWGLKDRFFKVAETLPEDRFEIKLFCFDTKVVETTLASKKMYGGGGTSFRIIEEFIQKEINAANIKYPEAVFVITDGWGDRVTPSEPYKWYWFISGASSYSIKSITGNYIPKECNIYDLNNFE